MLSDEEKQKIRKLVEGNRRATVVVEYILEHGSISTEKLEELGYSHPPRAARDVRERGVPLDTKRTRASNGKMVASYTLGDPKEINEGRIGGRKAFPKDYKKRILDGGQASCAICLTKYEERYLQIDHRVPYEISGDVGGLEEPDAFLLLCSSCNRSKSWSCEHCENFRQQRDPEICISCMWASPKDYSHVAMESQKRLQLTWTGNEVDEYDALEVLADRQHSSMQSFIKGILRKLLKGMKALLYGIACFVQALRS